MKQLFASTTLKLTAWYLAILMAISIIFSIVLYQVSVSELGARLGVFETRLEDQHVVIDTLPNFAEIRQRQLQEAKVTLFAALFYLNTAILVVGGFGSYALARRSLKPIKESHDAQARFAADASHELRTPLAVMQSELEVALRDPHITKTEMRELLDSNLEEVKRLSGLSQMLLQLSRHDYSQLEMKRIELHQLLDAVVSIHSFDKRRIAYTPPKKKMYIYAHPDSIKELIFILLDNALRYSPAKSIVSVALKQTSNDEITLSVKNSGDGISSTDLPHIFERFYRGSKSRTSQQQSGYGLGLSLAKKIADIHNAVIDITSIPGQHTVALIRFKKFKKIS